MMIPVVNNTENMVVLAGATGELGRRIASNLVKMGAVVKAIIRTGHSSHHIDALHKQGVIIVEVDYNNEANLSNACSGSSCVVSALSGLRDVIVDVQTRLLEAAINVGVPRFIPSDYCIDFMKVPFRSNRNLYLRKEFSKRLDEAPIRATSILNGMFTELLTGQAPVILWKLRRVVYWGDADQLLDFTTMDNTAAFTAAAALDSTTPRFLRIAGEVISARGLQQAASEASGKEFHLLRAGGLGSLATMIKITKVLFPQKKEIYPPWQGMQYLHNMFSGLAKLEPLDNGRYSNIRWTPVREVLGKK